MKHIKLRMGRKHFEDKDRFPNGFSDSGLFSDVEDELLTYWGETMEALEVGDLLAKNPEEEHFLQAVNNPALANTCLEKVWLKYKKLW
jgi:uncharacterized protein YifE (UPF0438 family)